MKVNQPEMTVFKCKTKLLNLRMMKISFYLQIGTKKYRIKKIKNIFQIVYFQKN
jgi:hypothetical protein